MSGQPRLDERRVVRARRLDELEESERGSMSVDSHEPGEVRGRKSEGRPPAEWVSLGISLTITLGLVAAIVFLYLSGRADGPLIEVRPEFSQVRQAAGEYYLPLKIANSGDATAEDVMVEVSFTGSDGSHEVSEVTIDFLAGHATEDVVVVFSGDPRDGEVSIDIISYLNP